MNYNYLFEIDKNTLESTPKEEVHKLTYGIIIKVIIHVLSGHAGLTRLKILYHEHQIYPLNSDSYYTGDGLKISFEDYQLITVEPYELKFVGVNEDTDNNHSFLLNFTVLLPEEMGIKIPDKTINRLKTLLNLTWDT